MKNIIHYLIIFIIGLPVPSLLSTLKFNFNTATRDTIDKYVNFCHSVKNSLNGSSRLTWGERHARKLVVSSPWHFCAVNSQGPECIPHR